MAEGKNNELEDKARETFKMKCREKIKFKIRASVNSGIPSNNLINVKLESPKRY